MSKQSKKEKKHGIRDSGPAVGNVWGSAQGGAPNAGLKSHKTRLSRSVEVSGGRLRKQTARRVWPSWQLHSLVESLAWANRNKQRTLSPFCGYFNHSTLYSWVVSSVYGNTKYWFNQKCLCNYTEWACVCVCVCMWEGVGVKGESSSSMAGSWRLEVKTREQVV